MFITPEWLKGHNICSEAQRQFVERFPEGVEHETIMSELIKLGDGSMRKRKWLKVWRKMFGEIKTQEDGENG